MSCGLPTIPGSDWMGSEVTSWTSPCATRHGSDPITGHREAVVETGIREEWHRSS
jgi:hypothetical protein